jgi:hypothetical protein
MTTTPSNATNFFISEPLRTWANRSSIGQESNVVVLREQLFGRAEEGFPLFLSPIAGTISESVFTRTPKAAADSRAP